MDAKILILIIFLPIVCCAQNKKTKDYENISLEIVYSSFGKAPSFPDEFYDFIKTSKKIITSAIYGYHEQKADKIKSFIIDDESFNYDYFNEHILNQKSDKLKVILYCERYFINNEYIIVVKSIKLI